MGAKRMDQLKANLAAIHLKLTPDDLKSLDEASQLPPEYPQWMLAIQGADRLGPVDLWSQSVNQK
jgi:diketogulonate reductase-like aldo/keto reductase